MENKVRYTILIIDDDETTHEVFGHYLTLSGYKVLRADNGVDGLALMCEVLPDLVLLDVQMPEMDGFQVLEQSRRDRRLAEIPILMLTSLDRYNLKIKGLEMGADDYIVKPFNRAEILARVKVALRRSSRFNRNSAAISGELSALTLVELLQTMELGRRTCVISLPDIPARIYLEMGEVVRAEQGAFTGYFAFQRMFFLERGRFQVTLEPAYTDLQKEPLAISTLLLTTLSYLDELGAIINPLLGRACLVEAVTDGTYLSAEVLGRLPLPMKDCLCLMQGELKSCAEAMVRGVANGLIRISNDTV
jgi:DNA-binding response OmpR family regulator